MSGNSLRKKSGCNRLSNLFCKIRRVRAVQRAILRETVNNVNTGWLLDNFYQCFTQRALNNVQ